jgi:hypothetical protein
MKQRFVIEDKFGRQWSVEQNFWLFLGTSFSKKAQKVV